MKRFVLSAILCCTAAFASEPMRVSIFTPEGELYFLGIYEVTFKPKLRYNKAYSCVISEDFRPKLHCTRDPVGNKTQGRYCVKPDAKQDLMCSKSLLVGV